jgi:DNA-binding GntR family transcriptional regulator
VAVPVTQPHGGQQEPPLTGPERALAALRAGIRSGRYVPGQRLVEADLTRELDVGRNSLREAFSRLHSEGLLVIEPHRGASIRRLSRADVAELYDLSEVLEGLAARRAAERAGDPGSAEALAAGVAELSTGSSGDAMSSLGAIARFHARIAELGGSPRLTELLDRLHIQTFSFQLRYARGDGLAGMGDSSLSEHLAVARAISGGDPDAAEREMRDHLRNARDRFLRLPDSDFA